jgi:hypothetical protein
MCVLPSTRRDCPPVLTPGRVRTLPQALLTVLLSLDYWFIMIVHVLLCITFWHCESVVRLRRSRGGGVQLTKPIAGGSTARQAWRDSQWRWLLQGRLPPVVAGPVWKRQREEHREHGRAFPMSAGLRAGYRGASAWHQLTRSVSSGRRCP